MVAFAKRAVWVLVALTVVLLAATIVVARDRWRAVLVLGLSVIAAMVFIRSAVRRVADEAPDLAAKPGGRAAISAILEGATTGLLRLAGVLLIVAAAAVALALLRRRWRRGDLILVGAILLGVVVDRRARHQHRLADGGDGAGDHLAPVGPEVSARTTRGA